MNLALVTALSCVGMAAGDVFATILTVAEARGRATLAGLCDMGNDAFSKFVLVAYGGTTLTHHGIAGWLCVLPVLATGFITTRATTRWARRLRPEEGDPP